MIRAVCTVVLTLASVAWLGACATGGLSDQSQDFQDGYSAGCYNGKIGAGFEEPYSEPDPRRYGIDAQYTQGWKAGYTECFEQFTRFPPMGDKRQ